MTLFKLCEILDKNDLKKAFLIVSSPQGGYKTVDNIDFDTLLECGNMQVERIAPIDKGSDEPYLEILVRTNRMIKTHPIVNLGKD